MLVYTQHSLVLPTSLVGTSPPLLFTAHVPTENKMITQMKPDPLILLSNTEVLVGKPYPQCI